MTARPSANQRQFGTEEAPTALGTVRGIRSWSPPRRLRCYIHAAPRTTTPNEFFSPVRGAGDCREIRGTFGQPWSGGDNTAKCLATAGCTSTRVPAQVDLDCRCGFYAYWAPIWMTSSPATEAIWRMATSGGGVLGVIEGHGVTVIGEKGFRCQKARILALAIDGADINLDEMIDLNRAVAALGRHYAVPVYDRFVRMLNAWPADERP